MAIEFLCPNCSRLMRTPDQTAGKKGQCPYCGVLTQIPAGSAVAATGPGAPPAGVASPRREPTTSPAGADDKIEFPCQQCGRPVRIAAAMAGKKGKCPGCGTVFTIPAAPANASAPPLPRTDRLVDRPVAPATLAPLERSAIEPVKPAETIEFACSQCGKSVRTPASMAGKKGQCPSCRAIVRIPQASDRQAEAARPQRVAEPAAAPKKTPKRPTPGLTPLGGTPGLTPLGSAPGLTPLDSTPGLTPLGNAPGLTPLDSTPGLTPLGSTPGLTPLGNAPGLTPLGSTPGLTPLGSTPGLTPFDAASGVTPLGTTPGLAPLGGMAGLTPLEDAVPGLTPLKARPGLAPIAPAPGLTPLHGSSGLQPLDDGLTPLADDPLGQAMGTTNPFAAASAYGTWSPPVPSASSAPYQAARARPSLSAAASRRSTEGFGFASVLGSTWYIFWQNWLACLLAALAVNAFVVVGYVALSLTGGAMLRSVRPGPETPRIASFLIVWGLAMLAFLMMFSCLEGGLLRLIVRLAQGKAAGLSEFFYGCRSGLSLFASNFLVWLMQALTSFALGFADVLVLPVSQAILRDAELAHMIDGIVAIVMAVVVTAINVWIALTFLLCPCLIVDREIGAIEAMTASAETMSGNRLLSLVLLLAVGFLLFAFGCVTLGIGFLLTVPFSAMLLAVMYLKMTGQRTAG